MNDMTRSLIAALYVGGSMDPVYKDRTSGLIMALESGTLTVPFASHTNGRFWQIWNRTEKVQQTFDLQEGVLMADLRLASA